MQKVFAMPPRSPLPATSSPGSSREDQLLNIARRLFAHKGFHATSLRDIAEEAKITKAALYYHFPNKDDLYEKVVIQSLDALIQTVSADVARAHTPTEQVQAFMYSSAHFLDQHREHWLAGANAFHEAGQSERRGVALHLRDTYEKLLRRCITEGIASGEFRHLDAAMGTRFLLSGLNYVTRWHSPSGKLSVKDVMGQFVDMALFGMREPSLLPMPSAAAPQASAQEPCAKPARPRQKNAPRA
ncbi:MAG: TetR/AcrR family transcriptional regulator [Acidovorax sp.]|nr:TetR/AcrR family transcriptional regulator [Acidovorax sp.]